MAFVTRSNRRQSKKPVYRRRSISAKPSIDLRCLAKESRGYYEKLLFKQKECFKVKSVICGNGLIAGQLIKKDEVIQEYWGTRVDPDVYETSPLSQWEEQSEYEYAIHTDQRTVYINADKPECLARYANNSCEPNAELVTEELTGKNGETVEIVVIKAKRDIWLFEEITVSFGWEIGREDSIMVCSCPSKSCKGYIGEFKNVVPFVKKEAVPHVVVGKNAERGKVVAADPSSSRERIDVDDDFMEY